MALAKRFAEVVVVVSVLYASRSCLAADPQSTDCQQSPAKTNYRMNQFDLDFLSNVTKENDGRFAFGREIHNNKKDQRVYVNWYAAGLWGYIPTDGPAIHKVNVEAGACDKVKSIAYIGDARNLLQVQYHRAREELSFLTRWLSDWYRLTRQKKLTSTTEVQIGVPEDIQDKPDKPILPTIVQFTSDVILLDKGNAIEYQYRWKLKSRGTTGSFLWNSEIIENIDAPQPFSLQSDRVIVFRDESLTFPAYGETIVQFLDKNSIPVAAARIFVYRPSSRKP